MNYYYKTCGWKIYLEILSHPPRQRQRQREFKLILFVIYLRQASSNVIHPDISSLPPRKIKKFRRKKPDTVLLLLFYYFFSSGGIYLAKKGASMWIFIETLISRASKKFKKKNGQNSDRKYIPFVHASFSCLADDLNIILFYFFVHLFITPHTIFNLIPHSINIVSSEFANSA